MINSFLSIETITRGLEAQQLQQDVTASNLAKTYVDSSGYLITSRQEMSIMEATPLLFGNSGGLLAVGTGPLSQQITRLRNSFLDTQIQQESSVVGKSEILSNILNEINGIINPATGTLDSALTNLQTAWGKLAPSPTSVPLRSGVVTAGVAFATLARNQFNQLQNLQTNMNGQINSTVSNINDLLQQLSSLNKQLLTSQGANVNDLLDARDYALDKLSRLINIQANFGTAGTANVLLGGSSVSLVDGAGAAILQTNLMNVHNPNLNDIRIQSSEGSVVLNVANTSITGGNLGGELQARDVALEAYKTQLDQVVTSVMFVTNTLVNSGYALDGVSTGNDFFTGVSAADINVNASILGDPTFNLLAISTKPGVITVTTDGVIAGYLGNIRNLLANNYVASGTAIGAGPINPAGPLSAQPLAPPASGAFIIDSNTVNYTTANSINDILDKINVADPNVAVVFNNSNPLTNPLGQRFFMFSTKPISIADSGTGNFVNVWGGLNEFLTSTIRMNNGFAPNEPGIDQFGPLNSKVQVAPFPPTGPNTQAFRVTPGTSGIFSINGVQFRWYNTNSLDYIFNSPVGAPPLPNQIGINNFGWVGSTIQASFDPVTQTVQLTSSFPPQPIQIVDITGNFTVFTGLNGNTSIDNLSNGVLSQITNDVSAQQLIQGQSTASLTQLNNAQADAAAVAINSGDHGEPIAVEQQNAVNSLIAYNASLQVLQVIDQMYADLVNIVGGAPSNNFFQPRA